MDTIPTDRPADRPTDHPAGAQHADAIRPADAHGGSRASAPGPADGRTRGPHPATSSPRIRRLIALSATGGAAAAALSGLLVLLLPGLSPFATDMPGLLGFAGSAAGAIELGLGLAALALLAVRRALPATIGAAAAAALGIALAATMPGAAIAVAGYLLAIAVLVGAPVALLLLAVRRPAWGAPLLALLIVGIATGEVTGAFPLSGFLLVFASSLDTVWLAMLATAAHTIGGVAMLSLALPSPESATADAVRRARAPLTIAAAACALPYLVARATWLTPWPLFGPSRATLDGSPEMLVTGILLAAAMLLGAVLTLGLILPWGERFPRWLPRVGGRPVPVAFAVGPALLVSVLFTAGGIGLLGLGGAAADTGALPMVTMALVLPFWLWGPLLALATWGYALDRAGERGAPVS